MNIMHTFFKEYMQGENTFTFFISQLHNHKSSIYLFVLNVRVITIFGPFSKNILKHIHCFPTSSIMLKNNLK